MSGFSPAWLALREQADSRARWPAAVALLLQRRAGADVVRIVDLGSGTGANCRHLAPRLGVAQDWLLVDHDAALLGHAVDACRGTPGLRNLRTQCCDLLQDLQALPLTHAWLLTASALLDLVSEAWLVRLADHCQSAGLPVLLALSYDGRLRCEPVDADDDWIRETINAHQRRDKGFGPALGPDATRRARALFEERGYAVACGRSDWRLDTTEPALQRELLRGWAAAAAEQRPGDAGRATTWLARRLAWLESGTSTLVVGHEDLLALPPPGSD